MTIDKGPPDFEVLSSTPAGFCKVMNTLRVDCATGSSVADPGVSLGFKPNGLLNKIFDP